MSTPEQAPTPPPQEAPPATAVDDANDLRGFHFKRLMRKPVTWIVIVVLTLVAGGVFGALAAPAIGGAAAAIVFVISIGVVFAIADNAAADDFFQVYAQQRGMTAVSERTQVPPMTPLLRRGDDRYAERTLTGPLGDGVEGTVAIYTYEEEHTDSEGNRETSYYKYTLGLIELPESVAHVPELYCQQKFGFRALEKLEDVFRGSKERVEFESEELQDKYEIFANEKQDQVWLRQLFAPTFIVWLTEAAPKKFAFELVDGYLCCYVHGHKESADDLDVVRAASTAVAKRIREESLE